MPKQCPNCDFYKTSRKPKRAAKFNKDGTRKYRKSRRVDNGTIAAFAFVSLIIAVPVMLVLAILGGLATGIMGGLVATVLFTAALVKFEGGLYQKTKVSKTVGYSYSCSHCGYQWDE